MNELKNTAENPMQMEVTVSIDLKSSMQVDALRGLLLSIGGGNPIVNVVDEIHDVFNPKGLRTESPAEEAPKVGLIKDLPLTETVKEKTQPKRKRRTKAEIAKEKEEAAEAKAEERGDTVEENEAALESSLEGGTTLDDVRAAVSASIQTGGAANKREIIKELKSLGVDRVPDLDSKHFDSFISKVRSL